MRYSLLFTVLFSICGLVSCNGYSEEEKKLFDKVKPGMSEPEVVRVLGKPDSRVHTFVDSGYTLTFFSEGKSWSTMPHVDFDSNGLVVWAIYSESEYKQDIRQEGRE